MVAALQPVLDKVQELLHQGLKGEITLHCPGDTTIRTVEVRHYIDLSALGEEREK